MSLLMPHSGSEGEELTGRFITMLSGMQSLLDLGMCREMPVVGFINGVLILGIIASSPLQESGMN
jgi:hypothetical protein